MKSFLKTVLATFIGAGLSILILFLFVSTLIGSIASLGEEKAVDVPSSAVLNINFSTPIAEQSVKDPFDISSIIPYGGMESSNKIGLYKFITAIDKAAEDPAIKFVLLNTNNLNLSFSYCEEIREALLRFRESGKPIIAYAENFTQSGYYLASVADKIYIDPMGSNYIIGVSANLFFLKDLLSKLGVEMQLIRHGKYKAAGEQFIANNISEANYEQNHSMVNSLWETMSEAICASRKIEIKDLNAKINSLSLTTPKELLEAGLIDGIKYKDEIEKDLTDLYGVEKYKDIKWISLDKYADARIKSNYKAKDKIAVVYAYGEIVSGDKEGLSSIKYREALNKVRNDSTIKAVVLRVNSPGGDAQAAEVIRREIELIQKDKPIIVSYGDYAASGGYWISAGADKIFTNKSTLTGSIGVFSMLPNGEKAIKNKLHITPVSISTHKHSAMMSLTKPLDKTETESLQKSIEVVYDKFLGIVSEGRSMSIEEVDEVAQGRVWTGIQGIEVGLTDEIGGLYDAINYAISISELDNYKLVEYPKVESSVDKMMKSLEKTASAASAFTDPTKAFKTLYQYMIDQQGVMARIPYNIVF